MTGTRVPPSTLSCACAQSPPSTRGSTRSCVLARRTGRRLFSLPTRGLFWLGCFVSLALALALSASASAASAAASAPSAARAPTDDANGARATGGSLGLFRPSTADDFLTELVETSSGVRSDQPDQNNPIMVANRNRVKRERLGGLRGTDDPGRGTERAMKSAEEENTKRMQEEGLKLSREEEVKYSTVEKRKTAAEARNKAWDDDIRAQNEQRKKRSREIELKTSQRTLNAVEEEKRKREVEYNELDREKELDEAQSKAEEHAARRNRELELDRIGEREHKLTTSYMQDLDETSRKHRKESTRKDKSMQRAQRRKENFVKQQNEKVAKTGENAQKVEQAKVERNDKEQNKKQELRTKESQQKEEASDKANERSGKLTDAANERNTKDSEQQGKRNVAQQEEAMKAEATAKNEQQTKMVQNAHEAAQKGIQEAQVKAREQVLKYGDRVIIKGWKGSVWSCRDTGKLAQWSSTGPWEMFYLEHPTNPADRSFLRYGSEVGFRGWNGKHVVAESGGETNCNRPWLKEWERFVILDKTGAASRKTVKNGASVGFRSFHGRHVASEGDGTSINANRPWVQQWEIHVIQKI